MKIFIKIMKIILLLGLAIGWMFCIYKLSGMNSSNSNGKSTGLIGVFIEDTLDITNEYGITNSHPSDSKIAKVSQLINPPMRKVMHASVYFVLAFFIMILLNIIFEHRDFLIVLTLAFLICVGFAVSDEYHQTFVAGRTGQAIDVIIDSAGATFGLVFYSTYHLMYKFGYKKGMEDTKDELE